MIRSGVTFSVQQQAYNSSKPHICIDSDTEEERLCLCSLFSSCDTPGIEVNQPHPEGEPCIIMYEMHFFAEFIVFLLQPRVFSRALVCGALRKAACTRWSKCGSRPDSVTRALCIQSREIWQVIAGLLSDELEPTKPMQTQIMPFFLRVFTALCCCI